MLEKAQHRPVGVASVMAAAQLLQRRYWGANAFRVLPSAAEIARRTDNLLPDRR
jgi:hypothetical protein